MQKLKKVLVLSSQDAWTAHLISRLRGCGVDGLGFSADRELAGSEGAQSAEALVFHLTEEHIPSTVAVMDDFFSRLPVVYSSYLPENKIAQLIGDYPACGYLKGDEDDASTVKVLESAVSLFRSRREARENKRIYETMFDKSSTAMALVDVNGKIIRGNRAFTERASHKNYLSIFELVSDSDRDVLKSRWKENRDYLDLVNLESDFGVRADIRCLFKVDSLLCLQFAFRSGSAGTSGPGESTEWRGLFEAIDQMAMIIDENHVIVDANRKTLAITGRTSGEIIGKKCFEIFHQRDDNPQECPLYKAMKEGKQSGMQTMEVESLGMHFVISCGLFDSVGGKTRYIHLATDVTGDRKREEELNQAVKDKEVLMSELQHRVKNNMLMMSSLLSLESESLQSETDRQVFSQAQTRIQTMMRLYDRLYKSGNNKYIDVRHYLEDIAKTVAENYFSPRQKTGLQTAIESFRLESQQALGLGLILNELMTNSGKYNFTKPELEVSIDLRLREEDLMLEFADDGEGFPDEILKGGGAGLGLNLIKIQIANLKGRVEYLNDRGARVRISIPRSHLKLEI